MSGNQSAVILFSHGSVLSGAGTALEAHAAALRKLNRFAAVEVGYLNYTAPQIEQAVENCLRAGATRIVIAPYFLVAGKFVTVDLPARLEQIRAAHPSVEFVMARAIEDSPLMGKLVEWVLMYTPKPRMPAEWHNRGVILAMHGSPHPHANNAIIKVVEHVASREKLLYLSVAYLECNKPDIASAIAEAHGAGVKWLEIVPYFLHAGRHVTQDIPAIVEQARRKLSGMEICVTKAVGESDRMAEVLLERIAEAEKVGRDQPKPTHPRNLQ